MMAVYYRIFEGVVVLIEWQELFSRRLNK